MAAKAPQFRSLVASRSSQKRSSRPLPSEGRGHRFESCWSVNLRISDNRRKYYGRQLPELAEDDAISMVV